MGKNYFQELGVTQEVEQEALDGAARRLLALYHPDKPDTGNTERFLVIDKAYKAIKDPKDRLKWIKRLALAEKLSKRVLEQPDTERHIAYQPHPTPTSMQGASGSSWTNTAPIPAHGQVSINTTQPLSGSISIGHNEQSFVGRTTKPGTRLTDRDGFDLRLESWRVSLQSQSCEYEVVVRFEHVVNGAALGLYHYWESLLQLESTQTIAVLNQVEVDGLRFYIKIRDASIYVKMNAFTP